MTRKRRQGVATVVCKACNEINGIHVPTQWYQQSALFQCHKCESYNRVTLVSDGILSTTYTEKQTQKGVRVHGIESE